MDSVALRSAVKSCAEMSCAELGCAELSCAESRAALCIYVCMSVTVLLQIASSFLFLDGIEPFFGRQFSMWHSTKLFRPPVTVVREDL